MTLTTSGHHPSAGEAKEVVFSRVSMGPMVCDVNPNLLQRDAMPTKGIQHSEAMASGKRQIFHAEVGRSLAKLREEKQLSQGQVALRSKGKISEGTLKGIETGRIKNPDPDHLRTLAAIYGVPFRTIAQPFIEANYGPDLVRHDRDQQSGSSSHVGDSQNESVAARILTLESENTELRTAFNEVANVAGRLVQIAKVSEQGDPAADTRPARSRRDRKTG